MKLKSQLQLENTLKYKKQSMLEVQQSLANHSLHLGTYVLMGVPKNLKT
jgi:hypothetical protein